ncbi:helix-turn-helix domain-containing protein [Ensifer sp. M14]|uniref:ArsR/SmtB family transcription factor n=1 Tax=Ensifer sp. M14 TaxID=2203782 RepID=UPI000E1D686F|nr:helix-turn-helix domain-containing protein [Ensifer sp. M14]
MKTMPNSAALDDVLLALANPVRRRIFEILLGGETGVVEVAAAVAVSPDALEQHLRILEEACLVSRLPAGGGEAVCGNPAPLDIAAAWIEMNRELWSMHIHAPKSLEAGGAPA